MFDIADLGGRPRRLDWEVADASSSGSRLPKINIMINDQQPNLGDCRHEKIVNIVFQQLLLNT